MFFLPQVFAQGLNNLMWTDFSPTNYLVLTSCLESMNLESILSFVFSKNLCYTISIKGPLYVCISMSETNKQIHINNKYI